MTNWCDSANILNTFFFVFDNFYFKQLLVLKTYWDMFFWLKKFKTDIEIALKSTGFKL